MKNNKGITLTSLIIYIAVIFVVIAALMRVTIYFSNNMQDAADVSFEAEFNKLNLYLLDETKTIGNIITNISEDKKQIIFTNGNTYLYNQENKAVYLNGTIKICENVESCGFEELVADNGKNVLELRIKINGIEKKVNYIIITINSEQTIIAEEDYIFDIEGSGSSGGETGASNETTWTDGVAYTYTAVDGSYVETSGTITDYASWSRTPYLYCKGASKLRVKVLEPSYQYNGGNGGYNCFYDENKNFIQSFSFGDLSATEAGSTVDIDIPANATYLICSGKANVISATNPNVVNGFGKPYLEFIPYT